MPFFSDSSRLINTLLILGVVAMVVGVLMTVRDLKRFSQLLNASPAIERGTLGQEGIACGGPERLPCEPGFVCDMDDDERYGTCVEDARETFPLGAEGVVCGGDHGCQPGLVCNAIGGAAGVCVKPGER